MLAFGLLFEPAGRLQSRLLGLQSLEIIVAAGVKVELALIDMQNHVAAIVQQFAVVADHQGAMWVFLQSRFKPERAFQVEVVGRLVQQHQLWLGEQGRSQGDAHAPAAREMRHRPLQIGG